ncbi:MAG: 50S ribosomal protein L31 [Solirubrobacteraceae bacterium]
MKAEIHPEYVVAHVRCTCGNEFTTRATREEFHLEICSNCHPFYTGRQKLVDTGGRVERFQRRVAKGRIRGARPQGQSTAPGSSGEAAARATSPSIQPAADTEPVAADREPVVADTEPVVADTEPVVAEAEPAVADTEPAEAEAGEVTSAEAGEPTPDANSGE